MSQYEDGKRGTVTIGGADVRWLQGIPLCCDQNGNRGSPGLCLSRTTEPRNIAGLGPLHNAHYKVKR